MSSKYKIKCNRVMGKMWQEVAHRRAGCNSKHTLNGTSEMSSMVYIYMEDSSAVLQDRMLSGALE